MDNKTYQTKAHKYIPGGAHTYSRGDDQFPSNAPPVLLRGEGCYVYDIEGNKFLDYGMALRSVTVGYGYERIANAALVQMKNGNGLTRASKIEVDAAENMVELIEGMDMVKFGKNGSSVTTAATKLARAYTGRKLIARCLQHPFFSYDDWFIGDTTMDAGIPDEIRNLTVHFEFNNLPSIRKLFSDNKDLIACVILEPATSTEPDNGFLNSVRDICHENGAVFILDEMITGFRWDLHGAQKYYRVIPDLCTFGKGMSNGFSVAALMGKREIMELGGLFHDKERVFLMSATHGAEMSSLGALCETINVYKELDITRHLWDYGRKLKEEINKISYELGLFDFFQIEGAAVSPVMITRDKDKNISLEFRTLFLQEMVKNKVLMPYIAISFSHNEIELQITLEAVKNSLRVYRKAIDSGIYNYLNGTVVKPVFRKFN